MTTIDQTTKAELVREIATTLASKQRLAFASDFHAFAEGRELVLAGVAFENFPKGPDTKRSDGDVVAHAIVMVAQAFHDASERGHLLGGSTALVVIGLALVVLAPAKSVEQVSAAVAQACTTPGL